MTVKRLLSNFLFAIADAIGLNWLARKMTRRQFRILMYHGVEEHGREANRWTVIDAPSFAWQMTYLAKHYETVRVSSLWPDTPAGLESVRQRAVVTFDDGLLNTLATAQPILAALNLPAVCFVLPGLGVAGRQIWADDCFAYIMNSNEELLDLEQYHLGTITLSKDREKRTASAEAVIEQMKTWPQTKRDDFVANVTQGGYGRRTIQFELWTDDA